MAEYDFKDSAILYFSKRGPEFIRYIRKEHLSEEDNAYIRQIEEENARFEKELNPESGDDE